MLHLEWREALGRLALVPARVMPACGQVLEMLLVEGFGVAGGFGGRAGFGFGPLAAEAGEEGFMGSFEFRVLSFEKGGEIRVNLGRDVWRHDFALLRSIFLNRFI